MDEEEKRDIRDRANDALNTYQNTRTIYSLARNIPKIARAMASAAEAIGFVELSPIIVVVFIGVATLVIMFAIGGQATGTSEVLTSPPPSTATPGDFSSIFKSTNNENGISDPDFYDLLKGAFQSPKYLQLITTGGAFNIAFYPSLDNFVGCQAAVNPLTNTINFYGFSQCNTPNQKYLASHEAGHIIENRNGRLYQSFPHSLLVQQDAGCYSSLGFLKSYFYAETGAGTNPFEESFAEAIALYLMPNERKPLTNFQSQCPNTYNWIRDNIFR